MREKLFPACATVYVALIFGAPLFAVVAATQLVASIYLRAAVILFAPVLYSALMASIAGVLSLPHQRSIRPVRLIRRLNDPVYFDRRVYGLCWTSLYYTKPVYHICLSIPLLRHIVFRLFGYRGQMNFTVYPDTWIRDLPLLDFGRGAYISNRATLGTNMVFGNSIVVDRITVGEKAVVGHLAMLGPGVRIGTHSDVGVGSALGIKVTVGSRTSIGGMSGVESRAKIGDGVRIGPCSLVTAGSRIADGAVVDRTPPVSQKSFPPPQRALDTDELLAIGE